MMQRWKYRELVGIKAMKFLKRLVFYDDRFFRSVGTLGRCNRQVYREGLVLEPTVWTGNRKVSTYIH